MPIIERDRDQVQKGRVQKGRESEKGWGKAGGPKRDSIILGVAGPQDPLSRKIKVTDTPN